MSVCNACVQVVEKKKSSEESKFTSLQSATIVNGSAHTCFIDTCAVYHSTAVNGGAQIHFVMHIW